MLLSFADMARCVMLITMYVRPEHSFFQYDLLTMRSPPPVEDLPVRLGSVVAALAILNIKISAEYFFKVAREVDEATRTKFTVEEFRECMSTPAPRSISDN